MRRAAHRAASNKEVTKLPTDRRPRPISPVRGSGDSRPGAPGVRELEVRKAIADLGAGRVSVREPGPPGMPERGRCVEAVMVALERHVHSIHSESAPGTGSPEEAIGSSDQAGSRWTRHPVSSRNVLSFGSPDAAANFRLRMDSVWAGYLKVFW